MDVLIPIERTFSHPPEMEEMTGGIADRRLCRVWEGVEVLGVAIRTELIC